MPMASMCLIPDSPFWRRSEGRARLAGWVLSTALEAVHRFQDVPQKVRKSAVTLLSARTSPGPPLSVFSHI
jgi:hypothetical protein